MTAGFNLDFVDAGPLTTRLANGGPNAYYHSDHLTSRVAETRTDGTVNWREHYTPFGERQEEGERDKERGGGLGARA